MNQSYDDLSKEVKSLFHTWNNFKVSIREAFGSENQARLTERRLLALRQKQSAAVYASEFQTLAYELDWDDSALASHFYEGLQPRVKDATITVDRPDTLDEMIETATKIDYRQYERYVDRRSPGAQPGTRKKPQFKGGPMQLDASEERKGSRTKTCYGCGKPGHIKRNCQTVTADVAEEWIEVTEEFTEYDRRTLSWTACYDDKCQVHDSSKANAGWYPKGKGNGFKRKVKRPRISYMPYSTSKPVTAIMMVKIAGLEMPALVTKARKNTITTAAAAKIRGYLEVECGMTIENSTATRVEIGTKKGFIGSTSVGLLDSNREYVILGGPWLDDVGGNDTSGNSVDKQPTVDRRTTHLLAYRNAILAEMGVNQKLTQSEYLELDAEFQKGRSVFQTQFWENFRKIKDEIAKRHGRDPATKEWFSHVSKLQNDEALDEFDSESAANSSGENSVTKEPGKSQWQDKLNKLRRKRVSLENTLRIRTKPGWNNKPIEKRIEQVDTQITELDRLASNGDEPQEWQELLGLKQGQVYDISSSNWIYCNGPCDCSYQTENSENGDLNVILDPRKECDHCKGFRVNCTDLGKPKSDSDQDSQMTTSSWADMVEEELETEEQTHNMDT